MQYALLEYVSYLDGVVAIKFQVQAMLGISFEVGTGLRLWSTEFLFW